MDDSDDNSPYTSEHFKKIPKELRQIILEYPLGTRGFSEKEVRMVWKYQDDIVIFTSRLNGLSNMKHYKRIKHAKKITFRIDADLEYMHYDGIYEYRSMIPKSNDRQYKLSNLSNVVKTLIGTLDSRTPRINRKIDIVFADINTIYGILYNRFATAIPDKAKYLATKYTQKALDNIVDDHQDNKIFSLYSYLVTSWSIIDSRSTQYVNPVAYHATDEILDLIQKECTILYNKISESLASSMLY